MVLLCKGVTNMCHLKDVPFSNIMLQSLYIVFVDLLSGIPPYVMSFNAISLYRFSKHVCRCI